MVLRGYGVLNDGNSQKWKTQLQSAKKLGFVNKKTTWKNSNNVNISFIYSTLCQQPLAYIQPLFNNPSQVYICAGLSL